MNINNKMDVYKIYDNKLIVCRICLFNNIQFMIVEYKKKN